MVQKTPFGQAIAFPPLPEHPLGPELAQAVEGQLAEHRAQIEASESYLLRRILERLGDADPDIHKWVQDAKKVRQSAVQAFATRPRLHRTLRRDNLPAIQAPEAWPKEKFLEYVLPKLRAVRLPLHTNRLVKGNWWEGIEELINACTEVCWRLENYPVWGEAPSPARWSNSP